MINAWIGHQCRWKHVCTHFWNLRLHIYHYVCAHLEINACTHLEINVCTHFCHNNRPFHTIKSLRSVVHVALHSFVVHRHVLDDLASLWIPYWKPSYRRPCFPLLVTNFSMFPNQNFISEWIMYIKYYSLVQCKSYRYKCRKYCSPKV